MPLFNDPKGRKEPLELPDFKADCHRCEKETGTKVLYMSHALANACIECGCFRRGKPYLSKTEYFKLKPDAAKSGNDAGKEKL